MDNKESISDREIAEITIMLEFIKNIKDLLHALDETFHDKIHENIINDEVYNYFYNYNDEITVDSFKNIEFFNYSTSLFEFCVKIFPNKFFDILYENEEIFKEQLYLLPNINFSELYFDDNTSSSTKQTLWKYIQLILFTIITSIKDKHSFGDTEKLFEAINPDELKKKLESTLNDIQNIFNNENNNNTNDNNDTNDNNFSDTFSNIFKNIDLSNIDLSNIDLSNIDLSNNINDIFTNIFNSLDLSNLDISNINMSDLDMSNLDMSNLDISNLFNTFFKNNYKNNNSYDNSNNKFNNLPDFNNIHDHINNLINGKIGNLAKELAEETANELDIDFDNVKNMDDVFKTMFKSPDKLMGLVNNIGKKIDNKMKDGSIKESELLEEATDLLKNMTNMPGMNNFTDLFKSMNLDKMMPKNGKINKNAFENMMNQNVKMSKMKERMKEKLEKNKDSSSSSSNNHQEKDNLQNINKNLEVLQSEMLENNNFINDIIKQQNPEKKPTNKPKRNNKKKNKK